MAALVAWAESSWCWVDTWVMPRPTAATTLAAATAPISRGDRSQLLFQPVPRAANSRARRVRRSSRRRRSLPGVVGRGQHALFQVSRRLGRPGYREPGRGLAEPADLGLAGGAVLQMTLEFGPLLGVQRI
jgi:hypothetical protein